ncbi:DUF5667 domain-containing protein [Streptomyces sp. NPDC002755]|uniref:DUF5667 domain-containing protein n=1 Tax=Streptomyces sp. NPDC002884 TaxID=3154544 RepID=UPI0033262E9E
MTEETSDTKPGVHPDPSVAARLAVAENHLASHLPLLTPEAQAAMLGRVRQAAAAADPAPAPNTTPITAPITAPMTGTATAAVPESLAAAAPRGGSVAMSSHGGGDVRVLAHRRASAFAQALEEAGRDPRQEEGDEPGPDRDGEEPGRSRLLLLASALDSLPCPVLDPEVKVVQRAQLVAAMEQMVRDGSVADPVVPTQRAHRRTARGRFHGLGKGKGKRPGQDRGAPPRPRSRFARTFAALGLAVAVATGGFGGLAASSTDALPGDALYGMKLGIEDLHLDMADGDAERGAVHLGFASTRLTELRELELRVARENTRAEGDKTIGVGGYTGDLRRALLGLLRETTAGQELLVGEYRRNGSQEPIEVLSGFSNAHRGDWAQVRDRLPARLEDVADEVTVVFDSIERTATALQEPSAPTADPSPARLPRSAEPGEDPGGRTHRTAEV